MQFLLKRIQSLLIYLNFIFSIFTYISVYTLCILLMLEQQCNTVNIYKRKLQFFVYLYYMQISITSGVILVVRPSFPIYVGNVYDSLSLRRFFIRVFHSNTNSSYVCLYIIKNIL